MKLPFLNEDKSLDASGWILDYKFLDFISDKLEGTDYNVDRETMEAVLLIANGDYNLWKESMELLEK